MDVVGHDHPGQEFIQLPWRHAGQKDAAHARGHFLVLHPQGATVCRVELPIQGNERPTVWRAQRPERAGPRSAVRNRKGAR